MTVDTQEHVLPIPNAHVMTAYPGNSFLRTIRLMIGLEWRRQRNQFNSLNRGKNDKAVAGRIATATHGNRNRIVLLFFGLFTMFGIGVMTEGILFNLGQGVSIIDDQNLLVHFLLLGMGVLHLLGQLSFRLGNIGPALVWYHSFPVPARTIYFVRILQGTFSYYGLLTTFPVMMVVAWRFGWEGGWSVFLAVVATLYWNMMRESLGTILELLIPRLLSHRAMSSLKVFTSIVVSLSSFAILPLMSPSLGPDIAHQLMAWPVAILLNPFSMAIPRHDAHLLIWMMQLAWLVLIPMTAMGLADRLVRRGLLAGGHAQPSQRTRSAADAQPFRVPAILSWGTGNILGKDLLTLVREKNILGSMVAFLLLDAGACYLFGDDPLFHQMNPAILHYYATAIAISSVALNLVAREGQVLWQWFTLPMALSRILLTRSLFYSLLAVICLTLLWLVAFTLDIPLQGSDLGLYFLSVVGICLLTLAHTALGIIYVNPLEREPSKRFEQEGGTISMVMMMLMMASLSSLNTPWQRLGNMVLTTIFALALWQKAVEFLPRLLDVSLRPPPKVDLADGCFAAMIYLQLNPYMLYVFEPTGVSPALQQVLMLSASGILVTLGTLAVFHSAKVTNILATTGMRPPASQPWNGGVFLKSVLSGTLLVGAIGYGYLQLCDQIGPLKELKEETLVMATLSDPSEWVWMAVLYCLAAPLFEEFIFRGLIFGGLRQGFPVRWAVVASAALFAFVHPAIAVVPVFCLGVITALAYQRTGVIWSGFLIHAGYNAVVLVLS